ncbi:hypothetical protein KK062_26495 [Fulvivirgaceae bacterium PWU5]|uniref:Uncharacterized protein n=1 Tax=Dawidia cretensis TaxID=2782350 RepID=A0AAP2E444_9BACT|nr:hypothetical protein [Dawidia cretensis]MBT1711819.1 hypothetical protein [Dawidia cretensis]
MEKNLFIHVLRRYPESSAAEAQAVLSLKEAFPYSQLLHTLSARVAKDHGFINHQAELQQAAVYAADRGVLREMMTAETAPRQMAPGALGVIPSVTYGNLPATVTQEDDDNLAQEVIQDLERLHVLKANFELLFSDTPSTMAVPEVPSTPVLSPIGDEDTDDDDTAASDNDQSPIKSKKQRIIELARAASQEVETPAAARRRKKKDNNGEELIDEIANKETLTPENEKLKEQLEMIDHFIRSAPSIAQSKEKPLPPPQGDLSTIKAGEFGDNIVSETLVEILLKQGKKDKAIEVLKKLIWKFPQKKAYFAAQIEELKK